MDKINKINVFSNSKPMHLDGFVSIDSNDTNVKSFKNVVADMISEMNAVTAKPEQLVNKAMQGQADVSDVMAAIAQSELTVQAATTVTGKILQTYEKIMQIQI